MRKSIAIGATATTLLFGGAGVAHATELNAPATTTTVTAQNANDNGGDDSDNTGLWGLAGLLGLLGLAGLKRRKDADVVRPGTTRVNPPTA
jgi:LPXTG-motif cell wall-anchored protein